MVENGKTEQFVKKKRRVDVLFLEEENKTGKKTDRDEGERLSHGDVGVDGTIQSRNILKGI